MSIIVAGSVCRRCSLIARARKGMVTGTVGRYIFIHVNLERSFGGTNGERGSHRAKRANFGRGVRGSSPGKFQKPTLQMVQSTLFLSYICEYY